MSAHLHKTSTLLLIGAATTLAGKRSALRGTHPNAEAAILAIHADAGKRRHLAIVVSARAKRGRGDATP